MNKEKDSIADYLFYLIILILPFEEMTTVYGGSMTKWIGLVFFFFSMLNVKRFYGAFPKILIYYSLYMVIGVTVDFIRAPYLNDSTFTEFSRPVLLLVLMLVSYNLAINGKLKHIVFCLFFSAVIFSWLQFLEIDSGATVKERIGYEKFDRVAVLESNQNSAARFFSLNILLGIIYALNLLKSSIMFRIFAAVSAIVGLYALIKTSSRGGLLALSFGVMCIALTAKDMGQKIKYVIIIGAIAFAAGTVIMSDTLFRYRIYSAINTGETTGRTQIWDVAFSLLPDSLFFGFGTRMHLVTIGEHLGLSQRATHNTFIAVLMGTGIVGFSLFMFFYGRTFLCAWRSRTVGINRVVFVWFMMAFAGAMSMNMECCKWFFIVMALALASERGMQRNAPPAFTQK